MDPMVCTHQPWTTRAARRVFALAGSLAVIAAAGACQQPNADTPIVAPMRSPGSPRGTAPAANAETNRTPAASPRPRVVVLGDSLTAGLGLSSTEEAFPAVLQRKINEQQLGFEVINAGVSGDTSAGGLRRLDWSLEGNVRVLVLELGANDGLRGLSVDEMRRNLSQIIQKAQARGITVVLCGMEAPPNFGASYTTSFRAAYKDLAGTHRVALVPFLLHGVAGTTDLNQADGIHPNAQGAQRVAETVWITLAPLLRQQRQTVSS
jgi:acyl-CoA thioesterase I